MSKKKYLGIVLLVSLVFSVVLATSPIGLVPPSLYENPNPNDWKPVTNTAPANDGGGNPIGDIGSAVQNWLYNNVIKPIGDAVHNFITSIGSVIANGFKDVISTIFNIVKTVVSVPIQAIETLAQGVKKVFMSLFGLGAVIFAANRVRKKNAIGAVEAVAMMVGAFTLAAGIPPIGYAIVAIIICALGLMIVAFTAEIPPLTALGWGIVVVGVMIGLYGLMPKYALFIFAIGFAVVFVIAILAIAGKVREPTRG